MRPVAGRRRSAPRCQSTPLKLTGDAVREVPAVRQGHAEERVARLEDGHERGEVGLRAGVRLHVGVLGAEQLLRAVDRELLDLVHHLAAAVVALAREPSAYLLVSGVPMASMHRAAAKFSLAISSSPSLLAAHLPVDQARDLGIGVPQRGVVVERSCRAPGRSSRRAGRGGRPRRGCPATS